MKDSVIVNSNMKLLEQSEKVIKITENVYNNMKIHIF